MSVYNRDGDELLTVFDVDGLALSQCYDMDGNELISGGVVFSDSATITNVYTSDITSTPQGGCIDDDGNIYVCLYQAKKFVKYNIHSGTETQIGFIDSYGHANGMAYNPNTGYLYLASMNDTGEVYVFDTSLNYVETLYAKNQSDNVFNCWNICYDRTSQRFITMAGGTIYFFDDSFDLIDVGSYDINDWYTTRQDIETDGQYIYAISYRSNYINVFDMSGHLVKHISNSAFSGEPESMCYDCVNDIYYIEGKSGTLVIRQAEFKE